MIGSSEVRLPAPKGTGLVTSEGLEWTRLYQVFPAKLDMKEGIRPCPSEADEDEPDLPSPALGTF